MLRHARRRAAPRAPVLPAGSRDSVRRVRRLDRSRYYAAYVEAPPEPQFQLRWRYLQAPARTVFCLELGVRGSVLWSGSPSRSPRSRVLPLSFRPGVKRIINTAFRYLTQT